MAVSCPACGEENPDRAKFCLACGTALDPRPEGAEERKVVSILFVDLVGSTAAADGADPEDVRATLAPYHARVKQEIERFGGTVEKFVGDAVMAVFGAPVAHEDDAERAVRSALRILDAVDELGLEVRGAVGTGEAVVSLTARPERGEGIATGDVVNTTARLQNAAPVGGFVVDETTFRATRGMIDFEELEPAELKGKAKPVPLWRVQAARSRFGVDVEHGTRTPFVGRAHELTLLQETFSRAEREASVQLVTLTGEPGVGKTRVVSEFRQWLDDRTELVYWRQGRCLPYGEGITFWALGEIVKAQAGILESDGAEEAAAKLEAAVAAVVEPGERDWIALRLGQLVGAGAAAGTGEREETFSAWRKFLEGVAAARPLVVVIEDLHWADAALVAFLDHLVDWATTVPLLVLCTARPELHERHPTWGAGKRNSSTLSLAPLTTEETTRLIASLLQQAVLPAETQTTLLERAGGNPLYAEEFVRMLVDRGVLVRRGRTLSLVANGAIPVPETVHALIAARLDTLPAARKALLHDAAVVGKVFWSGAVASIGDRQQRDVEEGMRELVRKELVRPARVSSVEGQTEFSFWHLSVRDVAYGQIPREARAEKHRAVARWLEGVATDRVDDLAELLAYHYEEALRAATAAGRDGLADELRVPAVDFLLRAGRRARRLDPARGGEFYARAIEIAPPDDSRRTWARFGLLATQTHGRELPAADQLAGLEAVIEEFRAAGDRAGEGEALSFLSLTLWVHGKAGSLERQREAIEVLESLPPSGELASAYARLAFGEMVSARPETALAPAERAIEIGRSLPEVGHGLILGLQVRGGSRCVLGDAGGLDDLREGLRTAEEGGYPGMSVIMHTNLGDFVWAIEGPAAGLAVQRAGIELGERRGLFTWWIRAESTWTLFDLGSWDELLTTADAVIAELGDPPSVLQPVLMAKTFKALVLAHRGATAHAAALREEFLDEARKIGDPQVVQPAIGVSLVIAQLRGDRAAARAALEELTALLDDSHGMVGVLVPDAIRLALELGEPALARRLVERTSEASWRERNVILGGRAALAEAAGAADALGLYREAAKQWHEFGFVLEEAFALRGAARCGDPSAGARAAELFAQLGVQAAVDQPAARRAK